MKLIGNSVEISMIYLLESIENLVEMDIHWKSTRNWKSSENFNYIPIEIRWKSS